MAAVGISPASSSRLNRRKSSRTFKPSPEFPAIRRDVAMLVPAAVTHEAVLEAIRGARVDHLEAVELFDVFRGAHVPEGRKSMAYAFTYRAADRTLVDAEANAAQEKILEHLRRALGAEIRE